MKRLHISLVLGFLIFANMALAVEPPVCITVLVDNTTLRKDLRSVWGFACLVEAHGHKVLFDTGADPAILRENMQVVKVDPAKIEAVVFSHSHEDHTFGTPGLGLQPGLRAYTPHSFDRHSRVTKTLGAAQLQRVPVTAQTQVCEGMIISEPMRFGGAKFDDWEQSLVIDTPKGLVVVVGCSHPGIVKMVERIRTQLAKPIYAVFGGFHLLNSKEAEVKELAAALRTLGVRRVGATHCTGETAIATIRSFFGPDFIEGGAGAIIEL